MSVPKADWVLLDWEGSCDPDRHQAGFLSGEDAGAVTVTALAFLFALMLQRSI
jgi:hypothetical protein